MGQVPLGQSGDAMIDNYVNDHRPRLENLFQTRREFLNRFGTGFGALGLASLLYP